MAHRKHVQIICFLVKKVPQLALVANRTFRTYAILP